MGAADLSLPAPTVRAVRTERWSRWVVLAFVAALSATLWAFTRIPMAGSLHGWASKRCVLYEMAPSDWPCRVTMGRSLALYLAASALVSLAALVPAVVLALRGRRVLAFVPMVAPLVITVLSHLTSWAWSGHWVPLERTSMPQLFLGPYSSWGASDPVESVWRPDHPIAIGADLILLAGPIVAMILLLRPPATRRAGFSFRAGLLALGIAVGASAIIELAVHRILGAEPYLEGGWYLQGVVMILFGLLLPLGPGRPIWTIPLVACLLSLGAPTAIAGSLYDNGLTTFTFFRSALPLGLIGLVAAGATAFVSRQRGLSGKPVIGRTKRVRLSVVGFGLASAIVAVGTLMAALDPLPYVISTPLPTYLGARDRVVDLRARLTLDQAFDVASRYRAASGSFETFDVRTARDAAPELLWAEGLPPSDATFVPELTVRVVPTDGDRLRLLLVGPATTYCLGATREATPTFGSTQHGSPYERAVAALTACERGRWGAEQTRPFPVDTLCEGASDILLCRIVQQRLRAVLASPTGLV